MKSILLIGCGDFGHHLCRQLIHMKNEVLIMDSSEDAMEDLADIASGRIVADCTSKSALQEVGVKNFDLCFVCIGSDFRSNLIIVSTLKELGASYIVSETDDVMLEKLLLNNGADEVIHPNRDSAMRAAVKYSSEHIFDYVQLKAGYSIYEITPIKQWVGKSILNSRIRQAYNTYIIGIQSGDEQIIMPNPQTVIQETDRLMILADEETIQQLMKKWE